MCFFGQADLTPEIEQPRVVALAGPAEQPDQRTVYIRPVQESLQLSADFNPAGLGHPEEDDANYDFLNRQVQLPRGKGRVPGGHVPGKSTAPLFQLGQEDAVGLGCAALYPDGFGMPLQESAAYRPV